MFVYRNLESILERWSVNKWRELTSCVCSDLLQDEPQDPAGQMLRLAKVVGLIRNDWWQWWQREPSCTNGTYLDSNYVLTQWLAEYAAVLHFQSKYRSSFWVCFLWTTAGIQMEPRDFPPVFKFIHPCAFFISVGNRVCVSLERKKEEKNYNSQHQIFDSIHFLLSVLPSRIWDSRWEEKLWPPPPQNISPEGSRRGRDCFRASWSEALEKASAPENWAKTLEMETLQQEEKDEYVLNPWAPFFS